jgi:hypothetical protein
VSASIPIAPGPIIEDIGDHKEVGGHTINVAEESAVSAAREA